MNKCLTGRLTLTKQHKANYTTIAGILKSFWGINKLSLEHNKISNRINYLVATELNRYVEKIGSMLEGCHFVTVHFLITQWK